MWRIVIVICMREIIIYIVFKQKETTCTSLSRSNGSTYFINGSINILSEFEVRLLDVSVVGHFFTFSAGGSKTGAVSQVAAFFIA